MQITERSLALESQLASLIVERHLKCTDKGEWKGTRCESKTLLLVCTRTDVSSLSQSQERPGPHGTDHQDHNEGFLQEILFTKVYAYVI